MKKEYFQVYVDSSQALQGSGTPHLCTFDLSTIIPNIKAGRCFVRASYISVYIASSVWKANGVSALLVKAKSAYTPNSFQTLSTGTRNSSIIGLIPTGNDLSIAQNSITNTQYVEIGNIFNGLLTIEITGEYGASLASIMNSSAKGFVMMLDVCFEEEC
jgi:hypothetical protein